MSKMLTYYAAISTALIAYPAYAELGATDVLELSLEQLTNIQVTSVSKSPEKASEAAAAIFVVTADDIRRLGATSIPEALRIVPGLNVAQAGTGQWAVSARGFNQQFANKLLVLIDGRVVYTPLFNGVWWDVQDVVLEDIDRIEVIRGPGATLWGANAVNGVINIITKPATETQDGFVSLTSGNQINAQTVIRQGFKLDEDAHMRVYAKYHDERAFNNLAGDNARDGLERMQTGFRADWKENERHQFTLQGDLYTLDERLPWNIPSLSSPPTIASNIRKEPSGGNILGRWNYHDSPESDITLQVYYDNTHRETVATIDTHTFDMDLQHVWTGLERHEFTWGVGYRLVKEGVDNTFFYTVMPDHRTDSLYSAFLQDKITLLPQELFLTLGSKFEHNPYSGFEFQPSARLSWLVDDKQTLWAAVSRAVKTPFHNTANGSLSFSVVSSGALGLSSPPALAVVGSSSNPALDSERLIAYEAGYRIQPTDTVSVDVATFYNDYSNLIRGVIGTPTTRSYLGIPYYFVPIVPFNDNKAHSYGAELATNWEVSDHWRVSAGYTYLHQHVDKADPAFPNSGTSPEQQFNIRSTLLLPYNIEMDNMLYYVDPLTGLRVPSYYRFDTRLSWRALDGVELSVVGQNLFDSNHQEFSGFVYENAEQVPRSAYFNVRIQF